MITIARGFGSGGKEIGTKLAGQLGIPCYEKQILKMASDYTGISEQLFAEVDEKLRGHSLMKRLLTTPSDYVVEPSDKKFTSDQNLYNIQARIIREMANENTKDFNAMLHDSKDMPKIQIITDRKSIEKYGGNKMYFAPPLDYDRVMKRVPYGRVTTSFLL